MLYDMNHEKREQFNNKQVMRSLIERRKGPFGWGILLENKVYLNLLLVMHDKLYLW